MGVNPEGHQNCPRCGQRAVRTYSMGKVRDDCKDCQLHSYYGMPLVDQATHDARIEAHQAFDPLWQFHGLARNEAYKALSVEIGLPLCDCHIGYMTKEEALSVRGHVANILHDLNRKKKQERRR